MSIPRPEIARFREVYKTLPLRPQKHLNGNDVEEFDGTNTGKGDKESNTTPSRSLDQFLQDLRATPVGALRPFVINLNGDGSLLISIPRPQSELETLGKAFYYIVTDPWLDGTADFLGEPMFLSLAHQEDPVYRSIAAVELAIRAIENAAIGQHLISANETSDDAPGPRPGVDAIIVSNAFADHAHQPTLIQASPQTPILAAEDAVGALKLWDHFDNIWRIPNLGIGDKSPLPTWLNVIRLPAARGLLEVTHGILITWATSQSTLPAGILYAPHGVAVDTVETVLVKSPTVRLLALLHPVNETLTEGAADSLGVDMGLQVYRATDARVWVQIHDPEFESSGILAQFQAFQPRSLEEALEANPGPRPDFRPRKNGGVYQL
jgi:L-ascorbate metabolism protein UlaG (beta-lactamase superfamily)